MRKVVLLTGTSAVGKSSLAESVCRAIAPVEIIRFSELLLDLKRQKDSRASHAQLRLSPTQEAPLELIERSREVLLARLGQLRQRTNVIIDSHAVARESFGFRITPDSSQFLARLNLDAIFVLHATAKTVSRRSKLSGDVRQAVTVEEQRVQAALQDAVAVAYATVNAAPVFVIQTRGSVSADCKTFLRLLSAIGTQFKLKRAEG